MVLANVPSFRFSFRGNMRTYPRSGFSFRGNIRTYPGSGFRSGGTSAKTTLLETTLLGSSDKRVPELIPDSFLESSRTSPSLRFGVPELLLIELRILLQERGLLERGSFKTIFGGSKVAISCAACEIRSPAEPQNALSTPRTKVQKKI